MSACERCWSDAFLASLEGPDDQATAYRKLLAERTGDRACTPEEQAGPDALWCYVCHRRTFHQHTRTCTVDPRHGAADLDRCLRCSNGILDSRLGGMCGDWPQSCPQ